MTCSLPIRLSAASPAWHQSKLPPTNLSSFIFLYHHYVPYFLPTHTQKHVPQCLAHRRSSINKFLSPPSIPSMFPLLPYFMLFPQVKIPHIFFKKLNFLKWHYVDTNESYLHHEIFLRLQNNLCVLLLNTFPNCFIVFSSIIFCLFLFLFLEPTLLFLPIHVPTLSTTLIEMQGRDDPVWTSSH